MQKVALLKSISKQYLTAKHGMRRHRKVLSMSKLVIVSAICLFTFGVYAKNVSQASTLGWELDQISDLYKEKAFEYSIVKLENLQREAEHLKEANKNHHRWFDDPSKIVVVTTYSQASVK